MCDRSRFRYELAYNEARGDIQSTDARGPTEVGLDTVEEGIELDATE